MFCDFKNIKPLLQKNLYIYHWYPSSKAKILEGKIDHIKLNKEDGYEVAFFIAEFMNKHDLYMVRYVYAIENILHSSNIISVESWGDLVTEIENRLFHKIDVGIYYICY